MNKLFGLFLLALAFLAPSTADAACSGGACFWIGGAGTLDNSTDQAHWATTSGGATCSCVPATTDTITFDANSGTGTVTLAVGGGTWTVASLTLSNFNGTFDNSINNNNVVLTANTGLVNSSSVVRALKLGSGTWTLSNAGAVWNIGTTTNLTLTQGTSTIAFTSGTFGARRFSCNTGVTYATVTASGTGSLQFQSGNCSITTFTSAASNRVIFAGGNTYTIGTLTNVSGGGSTPSLFQGDSPQNGAATISSANNWTCDFCGIAGLTFSGGGTFAATNSYNFLQNTGITITAPSGGGGTRGILGSGI